MSQALTANRLRDGRVVFLGRDGEWHERFADAVTGSGAEDIKRLEKAGQEAAKACLVVNPYLIEIEGSGPNARPRQLREKIRAAGPTLGAVGGES
jgi:hypothetical protein